MLLSKLQAYVAGAIGGLMLLAIVWLSIGKFQADRQNDKLQLALSECSRTLDNERQAVRDKTAVARAEDKANLVRVERDQVVITKEEVSDYEKRIADLERRAAAARSVRPHAAGTNPGGGGSAPVPGVPAAAGGAAESARGVEAPARHILITIDQAVAAETCVVRLEALQQWNRRQAAIVP